MGQKNTTSGYKIKKSNKYTFAWLTLKSFPVNGQCILHFFGYFPQLPFSFNNLSLVP